MSEFIDLAGASGTTYRFRQVELGDLPATAGNLVVASGAPARPKAWLCAVAPSLSRARPAATEALKAHRDARLYVRLNVARTVREAEHADLVAGVSPEAVVNDLD
jgi:hypothetical protein